MIPLLKDPSTDVNLILRIRPRLYTLWITHGHVAPDRRSETLLMVELLCTRDQERTKFIHYQHHLFLLIANIAKNVSGLNQVYIAGYERTLGYVTARFHCDTSLSDKTLAFSISHFCSLFVLLYVYDVYCLQSLSISYVTMTVSLDKAG